MRFEPPLVPGRLVARQNRFSAAVEVDKSIVMAHVANSGRLRELLVPGAAVYLEPRPREGRVCPYDLALVEHQGRLVSIDARVPNRVIGEALARGALEPFREYPLVFAERRLGKSRLDFALATAAAEDSPADGADARAACFIEVKSCTLVVDGEARFPDAPTARGARHLDELRRLRHRGGRAAAIFCVQRDDAVAFAPNDATDPGFGQALRRAMKAGVEVYAYRCRVGLDGIAIEGQVPIRV